MSFSFDIIIVMSAELSIKCLDTFKTKLYPEFNCLNVSLAFGIKQMTCLSQFYGRFLKLF